MHEHIEKECEADDPMELVGMVLPDAGEAAVVEMADCFIEEFLRMGHAPARIERLFADPFYAGPHLAWQRLGPARIHERIDLLAAVFGPRAESRS